MPTPTTMARRLLEYMVMPTRSVPAVSNQASVVDIMSRDVITARKTVAVAELARQMLRAHIGCIPIVDEQGHPRGMVTKTDLVDALVKPEGAASTAADIMMSLAVVVSETASVAHCAKIMTIEDFHHVMIVSETGALVGVVSSQDIVRWLVRAEAPPRLDEAGTIKFASR